MLKPEQLCKHRGCGNLAAAFQFCVAVSLELVIDLAVGIRELDVAVLEGLLRQVEGIALGHSVGDGVFLLDEVIHLPVTDNLVLIEAAHDGVLVAEGVETRPEDTAVEESILGEDVHSIVLDWSAGEDEFVRCRIAEAVHRLALGRIMRLYPLALVCHYEVWFPSGQSLKNALAPCAFVINDCHLQTAFLGSAEAVEGGEALFLIAHHDRCCEGEVCHLLHLLGPYAAD